MSKRDFRENMYVQFSSSLPGIVLDTNKEKVYFDTTGDLTPALESFYENYLADRTDAFGSSPEFASGFYDMLVSLEKYPTEWVKGQVTGPISFGLTVTDQDLRASLYNELLVDVIVKNSTMNARWQIQILKSRCPNVIITVDEPFMASFGSAFISISREQAISMLDEVFVGIREEGGFAGVHCCGNTDWSVLLSTQVDILNLDAFNFLDNLALYPSELRGFLDRGGVVAWGIVPNDENIANYSPEDLANRLREGLYNIHQKADLRGVEISIEELTQRSVILPSCGLGTTTEEYADLVFEKLVGTGNILEQVS